MRVPPPQGEVAWTANRPWLDRIPFLSHCGTEFKVELALALSAKVFAPGEVRRMLCRMLCRRMLCLAAARRPLDYGSTISAAASD